MIERRDTDTALLARSLLGQGRGERTLRAPFGKVEGAARGGVKVRRERRVDHPSNGDVAVSAKRASDSDHDNSADTAHGGFAHGDLRAFKAKDAKGRVALGKQELDLYATSDVQKQAGESEQLWLWLWLRLRCVCVCVRV
jgi:hypothetical protein